MTDHDTNTSGRGAEPSVLAWLTNGGAAEITANSVASVVRAGFAERHRMIVVHTDDKAQRTLQRYGLGAQLVSLADILGPAGSGVRLPVEYHVFNTQTFKLMCLFKYIAIIHSLSKFKSRVIYADGDIVYLQDPAHYLDSDPALHAACVLAQSDRDIRKTGGPTQSPSRPGQISQICAGFTVWRPLRTHLLIVRAIVDALKRSNLSISDQQAFNQLPPPILRHVQLLPEDRFVNGLLYFDENGCGSSVSGRLDPIIVHANWMKGIEAKTEALKDAGLWYL